MRFSIVTPSFNQAPYLAQAMRSVLVQADAVDIEYIVIDGGSTDESPTIIESFEEKLSFWVSERDYGQYDAINKGFEQSTGDVMAWLNSDDMYTPWAFSLVSDVFETFPEIQWLTTSVPLLWDSRGLAVRAGHIESFTRSGFMRGDYLPHRNSWGQIQQESTFWRRSLWERAGGGLDSSFRLAADFELWARFFEHSPLYAVTAPLGGFRAHEAQKTARNLPSYLEEARRVIVEHGGRPRSRLEWLFRFGFQRLPRRLRATLGVFELGPVIVYDRRRASWSVTYR